MDIAIDVTNVSIDTDRMILRPIAQSDLDDFYAYASVPGVGEMAGWKHHESKAETRVILDMMMQEHEVLAIVHKVDQMMIGTLGLHRVGRDIEEAFPQLRMREIGYVLSKAYWGQGLMPEAVNAVIAYAFRVLKLDALVCCHFAENDQSRRVIEKCGFRFYKKSRYNAERLGKTFDDMRYMLFRETWNETLG